MAQRNPMNQRYQGEGPGGQTRKSAARAKPVTSAAASVHVKKKPQTDAEKRAHRKQREKEIEARNIEKRRKQSEKAAKLAEEAAAQGVEPVEEAKPAEPQKKSVFEKLLGPPRDTPSDPEYKRWKKLYWILIVVGIAAIGVTMLLQFALPNVPYIWMLTLGAAYAAIIASFFIDFKKVRPLMKAHQGVGSGRKTPKQLKHEQEAAAQAAAVEAARKAAKEAKKAPRRKKKDTIVPGDEQS